MTIIMYDSIDPAQIPPAAEAVAGYVNGHWPTYPALVTRWPHAEHLSITVTSSAEADCLDVESGDASISQVYGWLRRQSVYRPVIYTQASNVAALAQTMTANGIKRGDYRLWSAHYNGTAHICAPDTCGYPGVIACDGTQWTSHSGGKNLDESELVPDFFAPEPASTKNPVRDLKVTARYTQIQVEWAASPGASQYVVKAHAGNLIAVYATTSKTSTTLHPVKEKTTYTITVWAQPDLSGAAVASAEITTR
jgi:hypothetical protein